MDHLGQVRVGDVAGTDPDGLADAFLDHVADTGQGRRDQVALGAVVASRAAQDHVDLDVLEQPQRDPDGEQVAEADHVLAGVLHRGHHQHAGRPALGEQQLQRGLGTSFQVPVAGVGGQGGHLVDHDHTNGSSAVGVRTRCPASRSRSVRARMNATASSSSPPSRPGPGRRTG